MLVNNLKLNAPEFPELLARIPSPPEQLFWAGQPLSSWRERPKVAIVGSRKISPYGKAVTTRIASDLARAGVVIISGLAYGVDITAHRAALSVGGTSIAVLPGSIYQIYPQAHEPIAKQLLEKGTLISEYGDGGISFKSNFIARNRIVSGLADVLLITEAALKSGSLHTARFALEQNRTVMAVPGNITSPLSEGCNNLIKSGAIPVTSADDVFFALNLNPSNERADNFSGSRQEELVYSYIKEGLVAQDALAEATKLAGPQLSATLTMLELGGYIRPLGAGNWILA